MEKTVSPLKVQAVKSYGATVIITADRQEAANRAKSLEDSVYIHPFDDDDVIAGQGTSCYEALTDLKQENVNIDAVFAPFGGGGLITGTILATQLFNQYPIKAIGAEPKNCNKGSLSKKNGAIFSFKDMPHTIADGVKALSTCERAFRYMNKMDSIIEIEEENIIYWTAWLHHILKTFCEPSSSLAMAASWQWLQKNDFSDKKNILIIISGGNCSFEAMSEIWQENHLTNIPKL